MLLLQTRSGSLVNAAHVEWITEDGPDTTRLMLRPVHGGPPRSFEMAVPLPDLVRRLQASGQAVVIRPEPASEPRRSHA